MMKYLIIAALLIVGCSKEDLCNEILAVEYVKDFGEGELYRLTIDSGSALYYTDRHDGVIAEVGQCWDTFKNETYEN